MACSLTITSVLGIQPVGGVPFAIRVTGTATDCPKVNLALRCPGFTPGIVFNGSAVVGSGGAWSADVPTPTDSGCLCGGRIVIDAVCSTDPTCTAHFSGNFACEGAQCPTVAWSGFMIGDCNPDGTRTVNISATVTAPNACSAELTDGTNVLATVSGAGTLTLTGTGNYIGTVTFAVVIISPPGCTGISLPITLPACAVCPNVVWDAPMFGACDNAGNRLVTVTAHLSSPGMFTAELRQNNVPLAMGSGPGTVTLTYTGPYPGASMQTFEVVITSATTCGTSSNTVAVPTCHCPSVMWGEQIGDCVNGNRSVQVTAELFSPIIYTAELHGPGGTLDTVTGSGTQTLTHTDNYPGGSPQTFSVVTTAPTGCADQSHTVNVPSCDGNGDGDGGFCLGLRIVIAAAGAMALLAVILIACVPQAWLPLLIAAAVFAALAAIAWIVWALLGCPTPCGWGYLLSGQVMLGAGVASIILSGCCSWMILVGLIIAALGFGSLMLWKAHCNKSWCALAKEITYVIGGIVLPIISVVVAIPILAGCVNGVASVVVGGIFGPIAVYAAACHP
jgi:hypothetical protein